MKLSIILMLSFLVLPLSTYARLSDADKQQLPQLSFLDNSGFENGLAKWTKSGGTFSLEVTVPAKGKSTGKFTGTSVGNTLCSDLKLQDIIFNGSAGEASFIVKGGTASAYKAYVKNADGIKVSQDVVLGVHTDYLIESTYFAFASGSKTVNERTLQLCFEHTAASTSDTLYIDDVYFGKLRGYEASNATTMAKGSILTSDGTANGEFTACADDTPLVFDSGEEAGLRCAGSITIDTMNSLAGIVYMNYGTSNVQSNTIRFYPNGNTTYDAVITNATDGSLYFHSVTGSVGLQTNSATRLAISNGGGVSINTSGVGGNVPHACNLTNTSASGTSVTLNCAAGKILSGGGCYVSTGNLTINRPSTTTQWECAGSTTANIYAYALCCDY